jgi:Arylsulfotransferase (ASST)
MALLVALALALVSIVAAAPPDPSVTEPRGLVMKAGDASPGYTLYSPLELERTFLIDLDGDVVHSWRHDTQPGLYQYLREDGTLVRAGRLKLKGPFQAAKGQGGRIEGLDWDGNLLWRLDYANDRRIQHHDLEPLPNGNVLFLAWERKTAEEALAAGRHPKRLPDGEVWPDTVVEYNPGTDQVVWTWSVWDHLIQEHDPTKANYGDVAAHPERVDLNYTPDPKNGEADWTHANSVAYNPQLDQIAVSVRSFSEVWIIDHRPSTEEARGPAGDLLARYGNPMTYRNGAPADQTLFAQHDAEWIPDGRPGAGNLLVFNNGLPRLRRYSSVDEIAPVTQDGQYIKNERGTFDATIDRVYPTRKGDRFFSAIISGSQRLPNGNTLLTYGIIGRTLEVTPSGRVVWDYENPRFTTRKDTPRQSGGGFEIKPWWTFRVDRYPPEYPPLARLNGSSQK